MIETDYRYPFPPQKLQVKAGALGLNPVPLQKLHRNAAYVAAATTNTARANTIFFIMTTSPFLI